MAAAKLLVRKALAMRELEEPRAALRHATPSSPASTPGSRLEYCVVGPIADPSSADARAFIRAAAASPGCKVAGVDTEFMPASDGGSQLCLIQVRDPRHGRLG